MSALPIPRPTTGSRRWLCTADQYYRMSDLGFFADRRVELIGGEIIDVAAQGNWHARYCKAADVTLSAAFGPNFWVRVQNDLDLSPLSIPEPDLAVIAGSYLTHTQRANPTSALLVVEVSETTLDVDQGRKASLYAAAGIADYWVLNLVQWQLEVYRDPRPDPSQDFAAGYTAITVYQRGQAVTPLALPTATVAVIDLLPV